MKFSKGTSGAQHFGFKLELTCINLSKHFHLYTLERKLSIPEIHSFSPNFYTELTSQLFKRQSKQTKLSFDKRINFKAPNSRCCST